MSDFIMFLETTINSFKKQSPQKVTLLHNLNYFFKLKETSFQHKERP